MNAPETDLIKLESTIFSKTSEQEKFKFALKLGQTLKLLFELMLKVDEPRIIRSRDKFGSPFWTIYDPITRRRIYFSSELEVRAWLDRRYYQ